MSFLDYTLETIERVAAGRRTFTYTRKTRALNPRGIAQVGPHVPFLSGLSSAERTRVIETAASVAEVSAGNAQESLLERVITTMRLSSGYDGIKS